MQHERALRDHLARLLDSDAAHMKFEEAVKDFPEELRGIRPAGGAHSPWELLEHLRIAQWDILEFTRGANHVSPEWPSGYWPATQAPPDARAWGDSIAKFRADQRALIALATDESTDLYSPIPHGDGQTVLRELLLTADHNAWRLGQFILVRRQLESR